MFQWCLESEGDPDLTTCIYLNEFREYTVGRNKGYDIISANPLVSRNHGVIIVRPDNTVFIRDNSSINGIWINNIKIQPLRDRLLQVDDLIGIGAPSTANERKVELFRVRRRKLEPQSPQRDDIVLVQDADSSTHQEVSNDSLNISFEKPKEVVKINENKNATPDVTSSNVSPSPASTSTNDANLSRISIDEKQNPASTNEANLSRISIEEKPNPASTNEANLSRISIDEKQNPASTNDANLSRISIEEKPNPAVLHSLTTSINVEPAPANQASSSGIHETSDVKNVPILTSSPKSDQSDEIFPAYEKLVKDIKYERISPSRNTSTNESKSTTANNNQITIIYDSDEDENGVKFVPIKREPRNENSFSFSNDKDIDIVVLSDDDDIFPKSQLFDDVVVKTEPAEHGESLAAANDDHVEEEDNSDNGDSVNIFSMLKKDVEIIDYEHQEEDDEETDDDDCIIWFNKLSQSQDKLSGSQEFENLKKSDSYSHFIQFDENELELTDKQEQDKEQQTREEVDGDNDALSGVSSELDDNQKTSAYKTPSVEIPPEPIPSTSKQVEEELETTVKLDEKRKSKKDSTKKSYVKPIVIEAPHLVKGKRKAHEDTKVKEPSSKGRKRKISHDEPPTTPVASTSKTYSSTIDKSVKLQFDKRNKKRRKSAEAITKGEKQQIQEERRKKLKEIASKQPESKKDDKTPKSHTKPKVKVSNSRGLFLTDEEPSDKKKKATTSPEIEPQKKKKFTIPKKKEETRNKIQEEAVKQKVTPSTSTERPNKKIHIIQNEIVNSATTPAFSSTKKVRFIDKPEIRIYQIDEGNRLSKCNFKDAPMPRRRDRSERQLPTPQNVAQRPRIPAACPTENETLKNILMWVPMWLEEQKNIDSSPKICAHQPMQMLSTFNSPGDYYNIVTPLMLLELWRSIFQDWMQARYPVMLAFIDEIVGAASDSSLNLLTLHGHCLVPKNQLDNCPNRGDLLIVEILLNNGKEITKKFGYVTEISRRRLTKNDRVHQELLQNGLPDFIVNFSVNVKNFLNYTANDRKIRVRIVSRIGPYLRIFRSVSSLYMSPLCNLILKPNIKDYKVPKPTGMKLALTDQLDSEQMMCVLEACQICSRPEPGIYMIRGPPGTGKSLVITNIVRQLLYGENNSAIKARILICAPSNGAIDELTLKLLEMRSTFKTNRFRMIRMGPPGSITHPLVKSISVSALVEYNMQMQLNNRTNNNNYLLEEKSFLESKINSLKHKVESVKQRGGDLEEAEEKLKKAKEDLNTFNARNGRINMTYQEKIQFEREREKEIIEKADIVCTTLSSCMGTKMEEFFNNTQNNFTCCIVDEATQSNEQETLIPLMLGISRMVLVGDPAQLTATVLSQEAKSLGYGNSLFCRIQKCLEHFPENPIRMLKTQYRMHHDICKFPSEQFYSNLVQTSTQLINRQDSRLHPYKVFSLNTSIQFGEDEYLNGAEANIVLILANIVLKWTKFNIGIITPYSKQKEHIMRKFNEMRAAEKDSRDTREESARVVVNTVDGFQGQERDVIIISCVRYKSNTFLAERQRLNVSLTRAKHALYICGHSQLFKTDSIWRKLEYDAKNRKLFHYLKEREAIDEYFMSSIICKS